MAAPIAEAFVRIRPLTDTFAADTKKGVTTGAVQQQFTQAGAAAGKAFGGGFAAEARTVMQQFRKAEQTLDKQLYEEANARAQSLIRNRTSATDSDVNQLVIARRRAGQALDEYAAKERRAIQVTEQLTRVEKKQTEAQAQTIRGQIRNVATGKAGFGSLLNPRALAGFGLGGLAIGAAFQGLQHLADGLRVEGDEAQTAAGKTRNFAAALTTGDIVGGIEALFVHVDTAAEKLHKLSSNLETTPVDLRNFANDSREAAAAAQALADKYEASSKTSAPFRTRTQAAGEAADKTAGQLRDAASAADSLARAFETSVSAVYDVEAAIEAAGSAAARFGPERGGTGTVARERGKPGTSTAAAFDSTDTDANQRAIEDARVARTKSLGDDLALANRRVNDAKKKIAQFIAAGNVEGAKERQLILETAITEVARIQDQINAQEQAAAEEAARKAAAAAAKAKAAREKAAREAKAYKERNLNAVAKALNTRVGPYANTSQGFAGGRPVGSQAYGSTATATGTGFTINDLFKASVDAFQTFGSNIGTRGSVLSSQDARADLGARAIGSITSGMSPDQIKIRLADAGLTEERKQTQLLTIIAGNQRGNTGTKPGASRGPAAPGNRQRLDPAIQLALNGVTHR